MPHVAILGGGLAGLATAAALGSAGYDVEVFEARPFFGGRATSYPIGEETIDNCQHILLRCCVNLLDFYERLGAAGQIDFYRDIDFIEPGGRVSRLHAGCLPAPLHFAGAFSRATWLTLAEKFALGRGLLAMRHQRLRRQDLDSLSMQTWLEQHHQPPRVIERFWRQVLVSAINEELPLMSAAHGFQVFWLGFLAGPDFYEMGVPAVPLAELYSLDRWQRYPRVQLHGRAPVEAVQMNGVGIASLSVNGEARQADAYVSALPFEKAQTLLPPLPIDWSAFTHSPITGIHLWFDRPVTQMPHGTMLDRTVQWFFNKDEGRYLQVVVSASRSLTEMPRAVVIELALRELAEFLPLVHEAKLVKAHVVKEIRATFSACPGLEAKRPLAITAVPNLFLAGDWTRSGWPATMEGAVRSGYLAAEAVTRHFGNPLTFLKPDVA
ncbi:MAG: hydroxysqualene dehydroxylase HpnE [Bryobacteraceae bacterium]|nr:hydroxysqualene dehydroxylase HpnE [Bryobacteraceae bacterium]